MQCMVFQPKSKFCVSLPETMKNHYLAQLHDNLKEWSIYLFISFLGGGGILWGMFTTPFLVSLNFVSCPFDKSTVKDIENFNRWRFKILSQYFQYKWVYMSDDWSASWWIMGTYLHVIWIKPNVFVFVTTKWHIGEFKLCIVLYWLLHQSVPSFVRKQKNIRR